MIRIFVLILTPLLFSYSFAEEKYCTQENVAHCTDGELCALATLKVNSKGLACEVLESNQACGLETEFCNEIYVCKSAAIDKMRWMGLGAGKIYEQEAKQRGLTCGVNENRYSMPLARPTIVSEVSPENLLPIPLPRPVFINNEINPGLVPLPVFIDPNSWLTRV